MDINFSSCPFTDINDNVIALYLLLGKGVLGNGSLGNQVVLVLLGPVEYRALKKLVRPVTAAATGATLTFEENVRRLDKLGFEMFRDLFCPARFRQIPG